MTSSQPPVPDQPGLAPDPDAVATVLATCPGSLADAVHAVPALRHLRETYERAILTVATPAPARELLEACPYVDRVVDLERPSELLVERFDVAVSFAPPGDGSLAVDAVAAGFRAAWLHDTPPGRASMRPTWPPRMDAAARMLRLAWLLGGSTAFEVDSGLWPSLADRNGAARLLASCGAIPIAVVHVGGGDPARRWPLARWAPVVERLAGLGLHPVLVGSAHDEPRSLELCALLRVPVTSLVGQTSVGELVGVLERAALFLGGDSGPAALAGAAGVRSVVVGPRSSFEHRARPGVLELVTPVACPACGERACEHEPRPAGDVPLDAVLARVELVAALALDRWRAEHIA